MFQINADTLKPSEEFTYLGRKNAYNKSDWTAVNLNLQKTWRRWGMVARVLERTGATVQTHVEMYKAVAKMLLLYGSESWVVTGKILKVLMGFHHRAA